MRFRGLLSAAGALTLSFGATPAFADQPTPIHLVEVYDITPGEFATHEVTLSTAVPLVAQQCQSMGAGAQASSATLTDVDGVTGCHFTWELEDAGVEVVTIDDGGVFHFHSVSASLLEGFSTPEAVATIDSVTLVAHASTIVEASAGGAITSAGASTKTDASTVTWLNVNEDVNATGTVDPSAVDVASSPSPAAALPFAPQKPRGGGLLSSLALIVAITGGVVALAFIGAIARWVGRVKQAPTRNSSETRSCAPPSVRQHWMRGRPPPPMPAPGPHLRVLRSRACHAPRRTRPRPAGLSRPPLPSEVPARYPMWK